MPGSRQLRFFSGLAFEALIPTRAMISKPSSFATAFFTKAWYFLSLRLSSSRTLSISGSTFRHQHAALNLAAELTVNDLRVLERPRDRGVFGDEFPTP